MSSLYAGTLSLRICTSIPCPLVIFLFQNYYSLIYTFTVYRFSLRYILYILYLVHHSVSDIYSLLYLVHYSVQDIFLSLYLAHHSVSDIYLYYWSSTFVLCYHLVCFSLTIPFVQYIYILFNWSSFPFLLVYLCPRYYYPTAKLLLSKVRRTGQSYDNTCVQGKLRWY